MTTEEFLFQRTTRRWEKAACPAAGAATALAPSSVAWTALATGDSKQWTSSTLISRRGCRRAPDVTRWLLRWGPRRAARALPAPRPASWVSTTNGARTRQPASSASRPRIPPVEPAAANSCWPGIFRDTPRSPFQVGRTNGPQRPVPRGSELRIQDGVPLPL